jgi:UPF0755 protein
MKNNRLPTLIFSLILLVALCAGLGLAGWAVYSLPSWAETRFGPPAENLDPYQRVILSAQLLTQANDLLQPVDPAGSEQPFSVELGESTYSITSRLQTDGLIRSADAIRNYLVFAGLDKSIQAGEYRLSPRMTALEVAASLQDFTPTETTFGILPGWRLEEVAALLPTSGLGFSQEEFMAAASGISPLSPMAGEFPAGASLEGFLFPDTYTFDRTASVQAFLNTILENFQIKVNPDIRQGFARQGLSLHQAVTLASIVQREAVVEEEMPLIASVFYNRLAAGMKLEADSTTQYALGFNQAQNTWWTNPLSTSDLQVASPYNTYVYPGLPPGPIANPGLKALQSVAYPAQTPYFYFRAACDGSGRHMFAETFEQHVLNACP